MIGSFRDVHAYEGVTYQEFSVAIDSSGSGSLGGGDVLYYLVIDGWNNRRHTNTDAPEGMLTSKFDRCRGSFEHSKVYCNSISRFITFSVYNCTINYSF